MKIITSAAVWLDEEGKEDLSLSITSKLSDIPLNHDCHIDEFVLWMEKL
jgi:hypothetical protein